MIQNSRTATSRITSNPWTNKTKVRGEGLLNSIMNKYFNDADNEQTSEVQRISPQQKQYLQIANKIQQKFQINNEIDQNVAELFQLKKRCSRIDQILNWIQKVQQQLTPKKQQNENQNKQQAKTGPIDSSFIYLPIYCGNVFNEILKDCTAKDKRKSIGQYKNVKIKEILDQIISIEDFNILLQKNIL